MAVLIHSAFAAIARGAAYKSADCEACRRTYVYVVTRSGRGEGHSAYFINYDGERKQARLDAEADLRRELARAIDVVPCPACGWIQAEMRDLARKDHRPRWRIAGIVLLVAAVVALLLLLVPLADPPGSPFPTVAVLQSAALSLGCLVSGVSLLVWRSRVCRQFDPNDAPVELRLQQGQARAVLLTDLEKFRTESATQAD